MRLTCDPQHNIAYIRLREKKSREVETVRVSEQLSVDLAPDGSVYGIELRNVNAQLGRTDGGKRLVIDSASRVMCGAWAP